MAPEGSDKSQKYEEKNKSICTGYEFYVITIFIIFMLLLIAWDGNLFLEKSNTFFMNQFPCHKQID
jgi:hypothetical protein